MNDQQSAKIEELKKEIEVFLETVNKNNFYKSYDPLISILLRYKPHIPDKNEVIRLLSDISENDKIDENQDEVILEVSCCLSGWCSPSKEINW